MKNILKELARAGLYPWRRYFDPRLKHLDHRIDLTLRRVEALERGSTPAGTAPSSWSEDHLPILLNVISSQNAISREAKRSEIELRAELADLKARFEELKQRCDVLEAGLRDRPQDGEVAAERPDGG